MAKTIWSNLEFRRLYFFGVFRKIWFPKSVTLLPTWCRPTDHIDEFRGQFLIRNADHFLADQRRCLSTSIFSWKSKNSEINFLRLAKFLASANDRSSEIAIIDPFKKLNRNFSWVWKSLFNVVVYFSWNSVPQIRPCIENWIWMVERESVNGA